MSQLSQSGRVVTLVAVSQGNLYYAHRGSGSWVEATNLTSPMAIPPLNFTGVLYSTPLNQKLYYVDGTNKAYFDPETNAVYTWTVSAGAFPVDNDGNLPRLICTWRGRAVLSGLLKDPQNVFMSAVSDPTDFDYGPVDPTPTQAVAFNAAPFGLVGDVVTALVPYNDDTLVIGGDHSIYVMRGDPMAGGQLDLLSDTIGMAWGIPWCKDPYGTIYFVSNRMGIYSLAQTHIQGVTAVPQRISQPIEQLVQAYDTGATNIRLLWNDRWQGVHVLFTPLSAPAATTHLFYELRTGAWWTDQFGNHDHDPLACCIFDGNQPGDRTAVIGSWDGYVRGFQPDATDDDGTAINSSVTLGPLTTKNLDDLLVKDLQAVLGETSGNVTYAIYAGASAELALATTALATGTWSPGRNGNTMVRVAGHALYVVLTSTSQWAMETIRARLTGLGKVRRRGAA